MTTYRHPYNRSQQPDTFTRPDLPAWLCRTGAMTYSQQHTIDYWRGMYYAPPPWLSDDQVNEMRVIYESANPATHHVDHIVPLHGALVSGLHVPWNLQVISKADNLSKSNYWWPDCPDHLCPIKNASGQLFDEMFNTHHQLSLAI